MIPVSFAALSHHSSQEVKNGGSRELSEARVVFVFCFFFFSDYLTMYPWQNGSPFWVSEEGEVPYYVIDKYCLALQLDSLMPSLPDYQGTGRGLAFQRRGIWSYREMGRRSPFSSCLSIIKGVPQLAPDNMESVSLGPTCRISYEGGKGPSYRWVGPEQPLV